MNAMRCAFTRRALAPTFALVAVLLAASIGWIAGACPFPRAGPNMDEWPYFSSASPRASV